MFTPTLAEEIEEELVEETEDMSIQSSCWLVEPTTRIVTVYSSSQIRQSFSSGEVIDEKLGIRIPLSEIFA